MGRGKLFVFVFVLVLASSFVSAGFFGDLFNQITGNAITGTCTDTDNGANPFIQGTINGTFGTNSDFCLDNGVRRDGGYQLNEFYCKGDNIGVLIKDCEYGCFDGACLIEAPEPENTKENPLCNETDDGQDYFNVGITTNMEGEMEDFCLPGEKLFGVSKFLNEFYCIGEEIAHEEVECEFGCVLGKCMEEEIPETACLDTDKQNDPFVFGRTHKLEEVFIDECSGENELTQYYCAGGGVVGELTTICDAGCNEEKGVCFEGTTSSNDSECYDTDPLDDKTFFGNVIVPGVSVNADVCTPPLSGVPISVKQYSCGALGEVKSTITPCGNECKDENGEYVECGCSAGVCEEPDYPCLDTDGLAGLTRGSRTIDGGQTEDFDYCIDGHKVMEYFCWNPPHYMSGGNPGNTSMDCRWLDADGNPAATQQNPDNYCLEGKCVLAGSASNPGKSNWRNVFRGENTAQQHGQQNQVQEQDKEVVHQTNFFRRIGSFFGKTFGRN